KIACTSSTYNLSLHDALPILRDEAIMISHTYQLPKNKKELDEYKRKLRAKIMEKAGVKSFPELPFEVLETRNIQRQDYMIKNILDRKSTRLNSSHVSISYAVF